jgi:hypothetical protein
MEAVVFRALVQIAKATLLGISMQGNVYKEHTALVTRHSPSPAAHKRGWRPLCVWARSPPPCLLAKLSSMTGREAEGPHASQRVIASSARVAGAGGAAHGVEPRLIYCQGCPLR